ncbi:MAG TPA: PilZ domain-containing protein [Lysobacter sp.]|nr:PilZ domain-containing protein [Lysobacter sp.]
MSASTSIDTASFETSDDTIESRRSPRRAAAGVVEVADCMTDRTIGLLGNLSETGMLLIANVPLVEDALYQLRFRLDGAEPHRAPIEVGVHLLWQEHASASGQTWAGFRFINVPDAHRLRLRDWLSSSH